MKVRSKRRRFRGMSASIAADTSESQKKCCTSVAALG
jgi:hypothetical protein